MDILFFVMFPVSKYWITFKPFFAFNEFAFSLHIFPICIFHYSYFNSLHSKKKITAFSQLFHHQRRFSFSFGSLVAIRSVIAVRASGVIFVPKRNIRFLQNNTNANAPVRLLPSSNGWFWPEIQQMRRFFFRCGYASLPKTDWNTFPKNPWDSFAFSRAKSSVASPFAIVLFKKSQYPLQGFRPNRNGFFGHSLFRKIRLIKRIKRNHVPAKAFTSSTIFSDEIFFSLGKKFYFFHRLQKNFGSFFNLRWINGKAFCNGFLKYLSPICETLSLWKNASCIPPPK